MENIKQRYGRRKKFTVEEIEKNIHFVQSFILKMKEASELDK